MRTTILAYFILGFSLISVAQRLHPSKFADSLHTVIFQRLSPGPADSALLGYLAHKNITYTCTSEVYELTVVSGKCYQLTVYFNKSLKSLDTITDHYRYKSGDSTLVIKKPLIFEIEGLSMNGKEMEHINEQMPVGEVNCKEFTFFSRPIANYKAILVEAFYTPVDPSILNAKLTHAVRLRPQACN